MEGKQIIYVLVHEWQLDCGDCGTDVHVFKDLKDAQETLKELAEEFESYWEERFDSGYEKVENEMNVSFYEKENYCYNHEELIIYEREVK